METLQVASLRRDRRCDGRQVRDQLRILGPDRLHDHRARRANHAAPAFVRPQRQVLLGHQLVAQHAAVHGAESRGVARVHHLLRRGRVKEHRALDRQDQRGAPRQRQLVRAGHVARRPDCIVRARRQAQPAARARLVHDSDLVAFNGDGVGGAHSDARHARHAQSRIDPKVHVSCSRGAAAS